MAGAPIVTLPVQVPFESDTKLDGVEGKAARALERASFTALANTWSTSAGRVGTCRFGWRPNSSRNVRAPAVRAGRHDAVSSMARGTVDKRAYIWAFGAVVFEIVASPHHRMRMTPEVKESTSVRPCRWEPSPTFLQMKDLVLVRARLS